ncbi:MAG TPA: hypothetical protein VME22_12360 [Solirubrobacteraceae bacterium]|nr:hypothetical protein [Solirubrobacteraceae bacterium]
MPAIMIILNIVFITGVVVGIVGLLAWGIVSDRPFATYLTNRAAARAQRLQGQDRRRVPREVSGYRGPGRRAVDVGA